MNFLSLFLYSFSFLYTFTLTTPDPNAVGTDGEPILRLKVPVRLGDKAEVQIGSYGDFSSNC